MKELALAVALVLFSVYAIADIGPFIELGHGHFSGKSAVVADPDLFAYVYSDGPIPTSELDTQLVLRYTLDGGISWGGDVLQLSSPQLTLPSLMRNRNLLVVSYMGGFERKLASFNTLTNQWDRVSCGRSFDLKPIVFFEGGEYKCLSLDMPYPMSMMENYRNPLSPDDYIVPQGITFNERSINGTEVRFAGWDNVEGPYRTNGDLLIQYNHDGWPLFSDLVMCSGELNPYLTPSDTDSIFPAGFLAHVPEVELPQFEPTGYDVIGPTYYDPNIIIKVEVNGDSYESWMGQIIPTEPLLFPVYAGYPAYDLPEPLFVNTVPWSDTLWVPLSSDVCADKKMYSANRLWIKGSFAGHQTWACGDTIYIIGDITLANTIPGLSPLNPLNTTDKVNLISQKSVMIKYGYKDPITNQRHRLARNDGQPIRIYASLYALGENSENPRKNGVFSFEYQHPHPSVPAFVSTKGVYFSDIDLHRYRFPQTRSEPWPGIVDYPWYNPLWPESFPYKERGVLQVWGNITQHTRGYTHRSVYDESWPSGGIWDIPNDFCGSPSNQSYTDPIIGTGQFCVNYPGAVGEGVGYKKDYRYDYRIGFDDVDEITWPFGPKISLLSDEGTDTWSDKTICRLEYVVNPTLDKQFARGAGISLLGIESKLYTYQNDNLTELHLSDSFGRINGISMGPENLGLISAIIGQEDQGTFDYRISRFQASTGVVSPVLEIDSIDSQLLNVAALPGNRMIVAFLDGNRRLQIIHLEANGETHNLDSIDLSDIPEEYDLLNSKLALYPSGYNNLDIVIWLSDEGDSNTFPKGTVYHHRIMVEPVENEDDTASSPQADNLTILPNPSHGQVRLELSARPGIARLEIYNLRGQKVNELRNVEVGDSGKWTHTWDGSDSSGNRLGSGIYLVRVLMDNRLILTKKICLY